MQIQVEYAYNEEYLPSKRHKKPRIRDAQGTMTVELQEITFSEAPIAFMVYERLRSHPKEFRWWKDRLWTPVLQKDGTTGVEEHYPINELINELKTIVPYQFTIGKDVIEEKKRKFAADHILIDGFVYECANEPRYVVMTFGLGHNHGGTSMFVEEWYNPNIGKDRYFNALEKEKAIAEAMRIATARGDTDDLSRIGTSCRIEVLMPEVVHCSPQNEHGDGNPFLNKLYAISESSSSKDEAALLALAVLNNEINK